MSSLLPAWMQEAGVVHALATVRRPCCPSVAFEAPSPRVLECKVELPAPRKMQAELGIFRYLHVCLENKTQWQTKFI